MGYFYDHLDRIANPEYVPTQQDILYCRKATKTIDEFRIVISNVPFLFVDVGGQRTHRQKWFSCFDKVMAILFLGMSYIRFWTMYRPGQPNWERIYNVEIS